MSDSISKYIVYQLRGLPLGVFGESYIVVACDDSVKGKLRAEHHILTQRPHESLRSGALNIDRDLPPEFGIIDADFALSEGFHQAEIAIFELLEKRSSELNRPDVALLPFNLKECPSPFVGCRMRGRFLKQLEDIGKSSKCQVLSRYMNRLQQVKVVEKVDF